MSAKIPGNEFAAEKLAKLLASGKSIAFVGAGASAGLYPLWGGLITSLADGALKRGLTDEATHRFWLQPNTKPQDAVSGIKRALGDAIYGQALRTIFQPKKGSGLAYTAIHKALVQLPFRGLITTNYDPGLIEARHALRPELRSAGESAWVDDDNIQRWLTDAIFDEDPLPILFAHGVWNRSETVVLGVEEYRNAYKPGLYRKLFDKLWMQDQLIFVGFGFSDPWLEFLSSEVIQQTRAASEPRHLAIVGLDENEEYSSEMRRRFHTHYDADVYFYTITHDAKGNPDHSELQRLLVSLAVKKKVPTGP